MINQRIRYPQNFKTKRELYWYIRGLMDAKKTVNDYLNSDIERYRGSLRHMDFDKDGNTLNSSVQPSKVNEMKQFCKELGI